MPLVVDVDGTLLKGDLLWEGVVQLLFTRPTMLLRIAAGIGAGKAVFKRRIALAAHVDVSVLPATAEVEELIVGARAVGQPIVLASACDDSYAAGLSQRFDPAIVFCSDGTTNLSGSVKVAHIREAYPEFDYVGNSTADLPVWRAARRAYIVNASSSCARQLAALRPDMTRLGRTGSAFGAFARALRAHQWSKNLLLFLPALAAQQITTKTTVATLLLGFTAFCAIASAIYLVNDLADLERDRHHRSKRFRPLASGDLPLPVGAAGAVALLAAGFVIALLAAPTAFLAALSAYAALSLAYTFWLKTRLLLDVLVLAVLYTTRIVAGSLLVDIALSPEFVAFSIFLFFALAVAKRIVELNPDGRLASSAPGGRAYRATDVHVLTSLGTAATMASSLVYSLYVMSDEAQLMYSNPGLLWLNLPLLMYWQARVWVFALRGSLDDDPVVFALRDPVSRGVVTLFAATLLAAARL